MQTESKLQTDVRKSAPETFAKTPTVAPRVDVFENADEVLVVADVPGVQKESLVVRLENETLHLEAKGAPAKVEGALYREFQPVSYERAFRVPLGIDTGRIEAELKNGVVTVHLPKSERLKPKQIKVKVS